MKNIKKYLKLLSKYPVDKNWILENKKELKSFMKNNLIKKPEKRSIGYWLTFRQIKTMKTKLAIPIIAGIIVIALGGTAIASQNSLPNDTLYPVKKAIENVELAISSLGGNHKAEIKLKHALRRLEEVQALVEEHQEDGIVEEQEEEEEEEATEELEEQTEEAMEEVGKVRSIERKEELIQKMERLTERHREVLQKVHDKVPEHAKQSIERAMEKSEKGHQRAIENFRRFIEKKGSGEEDPVECEVSITCEEDYESSDTGEVDEYDCPIFECVPEEVECDLDIECEEDEISSESEDLDEFDCPIMICIPDEIASGSE